MGRLVNHKKTIAKKMMTAWERKMHISPFNCQNWNNRRKIIQDRINAKKQ